MAQEVFWMNGGMDRKVMNCAIQQHVAGMAYHSTVQRHVVNVIVKKPIQFAKCTSLPKLTVAPPNAYTVVTFTSSELPVASAHALLQSMPMATKMIRNT